MTTAKIRGILALSVVIGVFVVASILAIAPSAFGLQNGQEMRDTLKDFVSLFSGVVGTIVGYYFGKSDS